jgi:succinate dehydrogenase / fumarate reductase iron-sulfur subunit
MSKKLNLTLHVWRQKGPSAAGDFVAYPLKDVDDHMSFLEMLDVLNEQLLAKGDEPVAFDHDCREGICGSCGMMINGMAHGPRKATTACQLHMREFHDGDEIWVEPWRAKAFPIVKDLVVDRGALDRIVQSGGYISVRTGSAPDANEIPIPKENADLAMDAAQCIGCGACVAACPNASAQPVYRGEDRAPQPRAAGAARARRPRAQDGGPARRRALRLVHAARRVRGRLPQGHLLPRTLTQHRMDR